MRDWDPPFPFKSVLQELSKLFVLDDEEAPVPKDGKDVQIMPISQEEANHNLTIDAVYWARLTATDVRIEEENEMNRW